MKKASARLPAGEGRRIGTVCQVVFLLGWLASSGPSAWSQTPRLSIQQNGTFSGKDGVVFQAYDRLHIYSHVPHRLNERGERELTPAQDELRPRWRGEPYSHDSYQLKNGQWVQIGREFAQEPELYLDLAPCDPLNQLDLSSRDSEITAALGKTSKIKAVTEISSVVKFKTVIYSDAPDARVAYPLKLALLLPDSQGGVVERILKIGDTGFFCGDRILKTKLSNGVPAWVLLVYVHEPAGSADYTAVYSYLISRPDTTRHK